eukprot:RCo020467
MAMQLKLNLLLQLIMSHPKTHTHGALSGATEAFFACILVGKAGGMTCSSRAQEIASEGRRSGRLGLFCSLPFYIDSYKKDLSGVDVFIDSPSVLACQTIGFFFGGGEVPTSPLTEESKSNAPPRTQRKAEFTGR